MNNQVYIFGDHLYRKIGRTGRIRERTDEEKKQDCKPSSLMMTTPSIVMEQSEKNNKEKKMYELILYDENNH